MDSPGSGQGPLAGCLECGDEPSGSGATESVVTWWELNELASSFLVIAHLHYHNTGVLFSFARDAFLLAIFIAVIVVPHRQMQKTNPVIHEGEFIGLNSVAFGL
jgi:hypothetical protein